MHIDIRCLPAYIQLPKLIPGHSTPSQSDNSCRSDCFHARLGSCTCGWRMSTVDLISVLHSGH